MVLSRSTILLAFGLLRLVRGTQYDLIRKYSGTKFFDDWDFYGNVDNLTHGNANFLSAEQAASQNLAFVNAAGNAIMKVDNTTALPPNSNRDTIRITSKDSIAVNSVWIADMDHMPFGCSVWPAFWSMGKVWPQDGEIDTLEGVNLVQNAQMALHTAPGCTIVNAVQTSTLVNSTDCSIDANENLGCVVENPDQRSYGAAFAGAGGGVFVTEFAETAISIWFFSRDSVPSSLLGNCTSIDTSTLGTPVANYPTGAACDSHTFFQPQNLVFDITLCGDFAGNAAIFAETCPGNCADYVTGPPSTYDNAFFEVRSVRVYGNGTSSNYTGGAGPAGQSNSTSTNTTSTVNTRDVSNGPSSNHTGGPGYAGQSNTTSTVNTRDVSNDPSSNHTGAVGPAGVSASHKRKVTGKRWLGSGVH